VADVRVVVVPLEELRALIADAVRRSAAPQAARDIWVDAHTLGLGRRRFLRLAREGAFPTYKRGKAYVARRGDVDAYIERQRVPVGPRPEPPEPARASGTDPIAAALAAARLRVVKKSP
jgi:hypothetical protein